MRDIRRSSSRVFRSVAGTARGLRLVRLDMPSVVIRGDPVWLNCSFDLESDDLYSVKWYKSHREFFRYLPSESPPAQSYRLSGVYVDVSLSLSLPLFALLFRLFLPPNFFFFQFNAKESMTRSGLPKRPISFAKIKPRSYFHFRTL